ncbi:helix-turn-helix domain-containing protein [Clostridium thermarum]|uniref:helix-turn-helix domain-containing protein n=1 Tax=Clostridium thermarum TaxID=1716543 RepID=UPI0013D5ED97|nr:helix-turn-helix transcriptional regulator [Clostridium thermarum]
MVGNIIRNLRKKNNMTQAELANKVGVTTSSIGMYETEVRQPSYEVLCKLAEVFDVTVDYLLGRTSLYVAEEKEKYSANDLDPAYFRLSKEAQNQGISVEDFKMALDFIKRARSKND